MLEIRTCLELSKTTSRSHSPGQLSEKQSAFHRHYITKDVIST
jgi:hypothetical protein